MAPNRTNRPTLLTLLAPACFILAFLTLLPTVAVPILAFTRWQFGHPEGFSVANVSALAKDSWLVNSLRVTAIFTICTAAVELGLGVLVGLLLESWPSAKRLLRLLFALPLLMSSATIGIVWKLILNEQSSLLLTMYKLTGWHIRTLSSPIGALVSIGVIDVWQWTPFVVLLISLAIESATNRVGPLVKIDELTVWASTRHVWVLLIYPTITLAALFRLIDCLRVFDVIQTATAGGPGAATEVLSLYIYKQCIQFGNFGYAGVLALVLLLLASSIFSSLSRGLINTWME